MQICDILLYKRIKIVSGGENSDKTKNREIKACKKNHDLVGIDSWNYLELRGAEESVGLSQFLDFQKRPSWGRFVASLVSFEGFLLVLESQVGRNFISTCFRECHWPLNECQTTPCGWEPPWYKPLRLALWQPLYHHPPLYETAQFALEFTSLSRSCVVNIIFLKKQRWIVKTQFLLQNQQLRYWISILIYQKLIIHYTGKLIEN